MVLIYILVIDNKIVFFPMFIGRLDILFCEVSVEIFCSFFYLVIIDLVFYFCWPLHLLFFYCLFSTVTSFILLTSFCSLFVYS